MAGTKKYRILSLDGGGSWAVIQVKALMKIYGEDTHGHRVLSNFDLVAANSGGSIVAAALFEDLQLDQILALFQSEKQRREIFSELPWYKKLNPIRLVLPAPQFSTKKKHQAIRAALPKTGSMPMDEIKVHGKNDAPVKLIFASYNYDRDRAKFLRSWPSKAGSVTDPFKPMALADAVHASTNAPIEYFDEPASIDGVQYWDGGLTGYNNPALAAATEAIAEGWGKDEIAILSIGTANTMLPLSGKAESPVLIRKKQVSTITNDLKKLSATIMADPPDAHSFLAHIMLGGILPAPAQCPAPTSVIRLNPLIQPEGDPTNGWTLPKGLDERSFKRLVELNMAAVEQEDVDLIVKFCELWMQGEVRNQSIRAGKDFSCEIGFARFTEALAAWKAM